MNLRRTLPLAAVAVLAAGAFLPAQAGAKAFAGTYSVTLMPDPSPNAFATAGMDQCFNLNPSSVDRHELKLPSAGRLSVVLDSADPTGTGLTDWDLYVVDAAGETLAESSTEFSHEEVTIKFKKAEPVTVVVCNLAGAPDGKVTYKLS